MAKRKMIRLEPKSKFKKWFKALQEFIEEEDRATVLTDVELLTMVNHKLPAKYRISLPTFERWVSPTKDYIENLRDIDADTAAEFRHFLQVARAEQKMELFDKVIDPNTKNALGARFVMERKFKDMQQAPQVQLNSNPTINITTGNKEQQALIDGIVNGQKERTIEIEHKDVSDE